MSRSVKKIISIILAIIVVGIISGGAFYGGMKYGQSKSTFSLKAFQNLSPEQRQQLFQGNMGGNLQGGSRATGANFLQGEVIDKDDKSVTIKLPDGSSKIVFFSDSTKISKTVDGTINDVEIGKQIMVNGKQNSDGSYTVQTIQER